jgi:hypothetical protein
MRVFYINNDGGGFADHIEIEEIEAGTTVSALFATKLPDRLPGDYLIRVNRQGNLSRQQGKPKRPFRRNQSRLRKKKNPQVFIFIKSLRVFRLEAGGIEAPDQYRKRDSYDANATIKKIVGAILGTPAASNRAAGQRANTG